MPHLYQVSTTTFDLFSIVFILRFHNGGVASTSCRPTLPSICAFGIFLVKTLPISTITESPINSGDDFLISPLYYSPSAYPLAYLFLTTFFLRCFKFRLLLFLLSFMLFTKRIKLPTENDDRWNQ